MPLYLRWPGYGLRIFGKNAEKAQVKGLGKRILIFSEETSPAFYESLGLISEALKNSARLEHYRLLSVQEHKGAFQSQDDEALALIIDLDDIARTESLDAWSIAAWKQSFNEWVALGLTPQGKAPLLAGFTREATFSRAQLAVRLGLRELVDAKDLLDLTLKLIGQEPQKNSSAAKSGAVGKIIPFEAPLRENIAGPSTELPAKEKNFSIGKHLIPFPIEGLDGTSSAVETIKNLIRKSAPLDTPILLTGATGTGKERVAEAIHRHSQRSQNIFKALNCGALSPNLVEPELFGYVRGAFTGALDDKKGILAAASGGTLFLDEINELSLEGQVKLLRVLQEKKFQPVGSHETIELDVRLICASKFDLSQLVVENKFREDLLYRIRVMEIQLPTLSERRSDLPELQHTLLKKIAKRYKKYPPDLDTVVLEKFLHYRWPGNVRELENVLERASTLCWAENRPTITLDDLPVELRFATMKEHHEDHLKEIVKKFEREYIASTVRRLGGSKEEAAEILGLSLATLYRKLGND